jgi:hypothetical protein
MWNVETNEGAIPAKDLGLVKEFALSRSEINNTKSLR